MKLHNDKDAFKVILEKVSKISGINRDILEKDYYVTLLLEELAEKDNQGYAYFKGGTALYKCLHSIRRFSEDIDLTIDVSNCSTQNQKKTRLKNSAKKYKSLGKCFVNEDSKNSITVTYEYDSLYEININDQLQRYGKVKVESTSFTVSEPTIDTIIEPCVYEYSSEKDKQLLEMVYGVKPFNIKTISLERIFVDKIFAAEFYFERNKLFDVAKHLYDLTILIGNKNIIKFIENKNEFNRIVGLKRKEELERKGGIDKNLSILDFSFFNNIENNQMFIDEFNNMQKIYVLKEEDKLNIEAIFDSMNRLKEMLTKTLI